ncbi:PQ-loop repeat-containing protein [candidate division WOR-3 bacterium]|nr:PQ-loop repeat-containing protein [candidate division WOR-3 bacterium]
MNINTIGHFVLLIAALIWFVDLIPQVVKIYRSQKAKDLSLFYVYLNCCAYLAFEVGHILTNNIYLFWIYLGPAIISLILLIMVLKYRNN